MGVAILHRHLSVTVGMYSSNNPLPKPGVDTDLPFLVWLEPTRRLCQSQYSFSE